MRRNVQWFHFPLTQEYANQCVHVWLSTLIDERHPVISDEEMRVTHGEDYKEAFTKAAEERREQALEKEGHERMHGLENADLLDDIASKGLANHKGWIELFFRREEGISNNHAMRLASKPTDEDIKREVAEMKKDPEIVRSIEEAVKAAGCEVTEEVTLPTYEETAKRRRIRRGEHALVGLPANILSNIREGKVDVYHIPQKTPELAPLPRNGQTRYISFNQLAAFRRDGNMKVGLPFSRMRRRTVGWVFRSGQFKDFPDDYAICYYESPTQNRRGILAIISPELLYRALKTRHQITVMLMPTLLHNDLYPAFLGADRHFVPSDDDERADGAPAAKATDEPEPEPSEEDAGDDEEENETDGDDEEDSSDGFSALN